MSNIRKRPNAGIRCFSHDYYSRCIYHIVLNKTSGLPAFSQISGIPGDHYWPPVAVLSSLGNCIAKAISGLKSKFPFISILRKSIMPDHVHFAIYIREKTEIHLGNIIAELKRDCSLLYEETGQPGGVRFFEDGYYDVFLTGKGQLKAMLSYISDNPRRHILRRLNPGWFNNFRITDGKRVFEAFGNWELLEEYQRIPVKVSRKYSDKELYDWKRLWHQTILNDGILVSPFIHPVERKVYEWAIDNGGVIIFIVPYGFPDRFKPSGKLYELCAEGRLLLVSYPDPTAIPTESHESSSLTYQHCQKMNDLAKSIAYTHWSPIQP